MAGPEVVAADVRAAAAGDAAAWNRLVDRFSGLVWAVARGHRLSEADAADVSQTTWLRLAEHIHRLRDPERVGAWLATTARHESLRTLRRSTRLVPVDHDFDLVVDDGAPEPDHRLLDTERSTVLWRCFRALPRPCQTLLRTLLADPSPTYADVAVALEMPIGSIGPRRARCLDHLRTTTRRSDHEPDSTRRMVG